LTQTHVQIESYYGLNALLSQPHPSSLLILEYILLKLATYIIYLCVIKAYPASVNHLGLV